MKMQSKCMNQRIKSQIVQRYALRWEQEIAFNEIKMHLHGQSLALIHLAVSEVSIEIETFIRLPVVLLVNKGNSFIPLSSFPLRKSNF